MLIMQFLLVCYSCLQANLYVGELCKCGDGAGTVIYLQEWGVNVNSAWEERSGNGNRARGDGTGWACWIGMGMVNVSCLHTIHRLL